MTNIVEQKIPEATQTPQEQKTPEIKKEEVASETPEQINWRKFREEREKDRKEKESAQKTAREKAAEAQALKDAMEAILAKPTPQKSNDDESEEDVMNKKIDEAIRKRDQRYEQERIQRESAELPTKLASNFSDFNQIVTAENLDYLEYHYPEVARAFKNQPDNFDKWADIYKTVKKIIPNSANKRDAEKIERNAQKPQSSSVAGLTQTGDSAPVELTDKRRNDNYQRMMRVMKGVK